MHPNPVFRTEPDSRAIAFARAQAFGTLALNADPSPLLSHVPFVLSQDGTELEAHLVRSNPIARALREPQAVVISVVGPHGYISPDWYGVEDQVPTWNYVAVHLRGTMSLMADDALRGVLDRLSAELESRLLPKPPWTSSKMTPDVLKRMMRQIVPVFMQVDDIKSTFKLGQNKPEDVRLRAAEGVNVAEIGMETATLAVLMRQSASGEV